MSGIPLLLPQPPASVTAVTLYVFVGIAVCALVTLPLPAHCADPGGDRFGIEPLRAVGAVIAVVGCVALWPAALLWKTTQNSVTRAAAARAHRPARARARRSVQRSALRTVMRSDHEAAELPVYLAQPTSVGDAAAGDAQWVEAAAARVVDALTERRFLDAVLGARSLAWDVEFAFGPNSSQLWHATELLAHVCHEIGDDVRAVRLYARAATGWAQNFGADHANARAAFDRATALWTNASTAGATDPVTVLCASCNGPMQFLAQVVLDDLGDGAGGRGVLALFACQIDPGMCSDWEPDSGGNQALLFPADGLEPLAQPEGDVDQAVLLLGSIRTVSLVHEDESDYDQAGEAWSTRNDRPASSVLGQLGGTPAWIQGDETPSCSSCTSPMSLIVQLEEGPDHSTAMNFGGGGGAYAFACEPCGCAKFLWQC